MVNAIKEKCTDFNSNQTKDTHSVLARIKRRRALGAVVLFVTKMTIENHQKVKV